MAYTYILKCANNELYVGSTNDMEKRFSRHQKGWAARFTKNNTPSEVVYTEEYFNVRGNIYARTSN